MNRAARRLLSLREASVKQDQQPTLTTQTKTPGAVETLFLTGRAIGGDLMLKDSTGHLIGWFPSIDAAKRFADDGTYKLRIIVRDIAEWYSPQCPVCHGRGATVSKQPVPEAFKDCPNCRT